MPGNWQMQGFGHPMFRNIAHPFESDPPRVPERYNPVGSYRREFELPAAWEGHRILLHFEAVKSAAYFWLNGEELGYNQGGMEPVEFDVSDRVRPGTNTLAVRVLRYSDGTYLEDQDMWRLSGIYRDVYLRAAPLVHVRDLYVTTDLDAELPGCGSRAAGRDRQCQRRRPRGVWRASPSVPRQGARPGSNPCRERAPCCGRSRPPPSNCRLWCPRLRCGRRNSPISIRWSSSSSTPAERSWRP